MISEWNGDENPETDAMTNKMNGAIYK